MEKKEITTKTTIKAIITGFVSYGIIAMFICFLIIAFVNQFLNLFTGKHASGLYITVPLMAAILIYFLIHAICRISIYDVFKKCKTNPENYKTINNYLTFFFVCCVMLSIALFSLMLFNNLRYQVNDINLYKLRLAEGLPADLVDYFSSVRIATYNTAKTNLTTGTIILILGTSLSFLSLITYQRKMIKKYNEF